MDRAFPDRPKLNAKENYLELSDLCSHLAKALHVINNRMELSCKMSRFKFDFETEKLLENYSPSASNCLCAWEHHSSRGGSVVWIVPDLKEEAGDIFLD